MLREKIRRLQDAWMGQMRALFKGNKLETSTLEQAEALLLRADLGPEAAADIIAQAKKAFSAAGRASDPAFTAVLQDVLRKSLLETDRRLHWAKQAPTVWCLTGVNGSGKTTTCAKLAYAMKQEGKQVVLGACDTFRAGAVEQLSVWADRTGCTLVRGNPGADPAGVAYQALETALSRKADLLLLDTAGRLHTKDTLMEEAKKTVRVLQKLRPDAPAETLLVLDGTNGQNTVAQVREFHAALKLTGLIISKMDSGAKAGIAVALERKYGIPVKCMGFGEGLADLEAFDKNEFVRILTGEHVAA